MADRISALDPVVTPLYTDVLPDTQLAEVNVKSRKISNAQLTTLINGGYLLVDDNITLPSPCPNVIYYNFQAAGKTITLPPGNGANAHPAGKPIWFVPHPDSVYTFDVNTNDGTTYLNNLGNGIFALMYGSNANQNGTPIVDAFFVNGADYLTLTGGTLTGNLEINGASTGGFYGISVSKNANSPAQIGVFNQNTGANANAEIGAGIESGSNADAIYRAFVNGGDLWTWGLDSATGDYVLGSGNTLGSANALRSSQDGAVNFPRTPFAMAYLNAGQSNVTGDNTIYNFTGNFFTELFDQAGNFLNGIFTAPRTGKYRCNLSLVVVAIVADNTFLELSLVTPGNTFPVYQCNPAAIRTIPFVVNTVGIPISIVVPLTVGDTAYWALQVGGSAKNVAIAGGLFTTMSFKLDA